MTGGTLSGTGNITATDSFVWTGGAMTGSGKTVIAGTATGTLLPTYDYLYLARTLENAGQTTLNVSPTGHVFYVGDSAGGGTFSNVAGGTFTLDDSAGIQDTGDYYGYVSALNNAGTIRHTGPGTSTVSVPLHNSGSIDVQAGGLVFSGGGSFSGTSALTGDVGIVGGTYTIVSGASIGGAGRLVLQSGNVAIDGEVSITNLAMTGGTLSGSGNITATDSFVWTGGAMSGSGKTIVASAATGTLLPTSDYLYLARTLENAGQTTLSTSPSGYVMLVGDFGGGGTISNLAGGTFTLDDSAGIRTMA